jgi:hypothetical protein
MSAFMPVTVLTADVTLPRGTRLGLRRIADDCGLSHEQARLLLISGKMKGVRIGSVWAASEAECRRIRALNAQAQKVA